MSESLDEIMQRLTISELLGAVYEILAEIESRYMLLDDGKEVRSAETYEADSPSLQE